MLLPVSVGHCIMRVALGFACGVGWMCCFVGCLVCLVFVVGLTRFGGLGWLFCVAARWYTSW